MGNQEALTAERALPARTASTARKELIPAWAFDLAAEINNTFEIGTTDAQHRQLAALLVMRTPARRLVETLRKVIEDDRLGAAELRFDTREAVRAALAKAEPSA